MVTTGSVCSAVPGRVVLSGEPVAHVGMSHYVKLFEGLEDTESACKSEYVRHSQQI